jgi:hypothetical protein
MTPCTASIPIASNPQRAGARASSPGRWLAALLVGVLLASFGLAARGAGGERAP